MKECEEKEKIPSTFKEHIKGYLDDLKLYMKMRSILMKNAVVYVCKTCNLIYPLKHDGKCDNCGSYMEIHSSTSVTIRIPSRKEKYESIKMKNEMLEKDKKLIEEIENKEIINKFEVILKTIDYSNTNEILEYLIDMKRIDDYYENLPNDKKYLLENIDIIKEQKIENIIRDKFDRIWSNNYKNDLYKSFIEELKYCKSRFPQYKQIFNKEIIKIENCLEDLQNNKFIHKNLSNVALEEVDNLDGLNFEKYVYDLLKLLKYEDLKLTSASGDFGIDVLATKEGIKYAIQCKNYKNSVGSESVQEAYSGKNYYNCHVGIVITNNYFTSHAKELADKNGILLWDRDKLIELINTSKIEKNFNTTQKCDAIRKKNIITKEEIEDDYEEPLYTEIVEFIVTQGQASPSLLQRKFRIGYNRASRCIDLLEERGIVGPSNGSKPREVLIKLD